MKACRTEPPARDHDFDELKSAAGLHGVVERALQLCACPHAHTVSADDASEALVLLPDALPLEAKAVQQLLDFAAVRVPGQQGHVCKACATPDFHPGQIAPVGTIVATTPDLVIPAAIGTDINCGMR